MKLGRLPRAYDPRVPHHAALKAMLRANAVARPALLDRVDHVAGLPADLGAMLNTELGDCTCAAFYHFLQVITQQALGYTVTEPDSCVLQMYEEAAGYRHSDPSTDKGAVEQDVLRYLLNTGAPMSDGTRHTIRSYVEIDVTNLDDVMECVQEFGACYIGLSVPSGFMEDVGNTVRVWDARPNYGAIEGGHAVIITGFNRAAQTLDLISWGTRWTMTFSFWRKYVDEAYALVDYWLIEQQNGRTPYGLDLATLDGLSSALRSPQQASSGGWWPSLWDRFTRAA